MCAKFEGYSKDLEICPKSLLANYLAYFTHVAHLNNYLLLSLLLVRNPSYDHLKLNSTLNSLLRRAADS